MTRPDRLREQNFAQLQRLRRYEAIYRGGARLMSELIEELRRYHPDIAADLDERVRRYAHADRALLAAVGADRMPCAPIHAVRR